VGADNSDKESSCFLFAEQGFIWNDCVVVEINALSAAFFKFRGELHKEQVVSADDNGSVCEGFIYIFTGFPVIFQLFIKFAEVRSVFMIMGNDVSEPAVSEHKRNRFAGIFFLPHFVDFGDDIFRLHVESRTAFDHEVDGCSKKNSDHIHHYQNEDIPVEIAGDFSRKQRNRQDSAK